jgi:DEAD/DEAH box helicase
MKFDKRSRGNKRKRLSRVSDDSDDEAPAKIKKTTSTSPTSLALIKLPPFSNSDAIKLQNFKRKFWSGPISSSIDEESLKSLRKSVGVLVKGEASSDCPPPIQSLKSDGIPQEFIDIFHLIGLNEPTTVQKQCWPALLNGNNILALAPTGSGKTLAYALPAIPHIKHRLLSSKCKIFDKPAPIVLILVPTRELAVQVCSAIKPLKRVCGLTAMAVYGGDDKIKQIDDLNEGSGHAIVVATPGNIDVFYLPIYLLLFWHIVSSFIKSQLTCWQLLHWPQFR